jgi:hypothetical protein
LIVYVENVGYFTVNTYIKHPEVYR